MDIFHVPNQAEKRIFKALSRASSYRSAGDSPDESMSKAASELQLNPEMTKRACELFNITLTHSHFKQAGVNGAKREDDFPIADFQNIIRSVFTDTGRKTASAPVADPYSRLAIRPAVTMSKTASVETPERQSTNLAFLVQQAEGSIKELEFENRKVAMDVMSYHHSALDTLRSLVDHFRTTGNTQKYAEFENQCYSEYGTPAGRYLDLLYAQLPEQPARGDSQTYSKHAGIFDAGFANSQFDRFVEAVDQYLDCQIKRASLQMELDSRRDSVQNIYARVSDTPRNSKTAAGLLDFDKQAAIGSLPIEIAGVPEALHASREKSLSGQFDKSNEHAVSSLHQRPQQEADQEMENVRRMTILKDLMMNDEIISRQEPDSVSNAYNTLLQISPTSTMHKEVVRAVLRNATAQQAVDPFTAKQLADLEGVHLKNKALASGNIAPKVS